MSDDATEVERVWRAHAARLRAYLASRLRNPSDVDDVLQDVLIKTHAGLPGLRDPGRLVPWLYRVTRNALLDHARKARSRRDTGQRSERDIVDSRREPLDDVRSELASCVRPFVEALPERYRETMAAVELEGRPQKEVAKRLGISLSAVKSRVQRGRRMLRGVFDRCCTVQIDRRGNVIDYERNGDCSAEGC